MLPALPLDLLVPLFSLDVWSFPCLQNTTHSLSFHHHAILSLGFVFCIPLLGDPCDYSGLWLMAEIVSSQKPYFISAMSLTPTASGNEKVKIHSCVKNATLYTFNILLSNL